MPPWYYPAEAFDRVYALSDLHGDVDVAILLFRDVMGAVGPGGDDDWLWTAPPRTCIVVCGDVVDRSRDAGHGGPEYGENDWQPDVPDDLYLLRLLNEWARLADEADTGGCVLRLLGNHDFNGAITTSECVTAHSLQLLWELEQQDGADPEANRCASFSNPGAAFFDAIWDAPSVRLLVQIGPYLFAHAGVSMATVSLLDGNGGSVDELLRAVREAMCARGSKGLEVGIADVMQMRLHTVAAPCPGDLAAQILRHFSEAVATEPVHTLVTGHNTTTPLMCHRHAESCQVHTRRVDADDRRAVFDTLGPYQPGGPWINASMSDPQGLFPGGDAVVWRLDVGATRAWCTSSPDWEVWPQVLGIRPATGETQTLMASQPMAAR